MSTHVYFPNQDNLFQDSNLTNFFKNRRIQTRDIEREVERFVLENSIGCDSTKYARSWLLGESWKKTLLPNILLVGRKHEETFKPHMIQDIEFTFSFSFSDEEEEF